jgi:hypothetical protein
MTAKRGILEAVKINGKVVSLRRADQFASKPDTSKLARLIAAYAPHDGSFELRIPGVHASRFPEPTGSVCMPCECPHCACWPKERRPSS